MPSTAVHALRYPALGDSPNVPLDVQRLAEDAERELNEHDASLALLTPYAWRGYVAADTAVGASTNVSPALTADIVVGSGWATPGAGQVTIPVAGIYRVSVHSTWKTGSGGYGGAYLKRHATNVSTITARSLITGEWVTASASTLASFAAGEVVRFDLFQDTSAAISVVGSPDATGVAIDLVART